MEISILIPTYRRPDKAAACLSRLASQTLHADWYEVLVGLDGPDEATAGAAERAWSEAGGRRGGLTILPCPREGLNATRNRLLSVAQGQLMLSLNDDVLAEPGLLDAHLCAHAETREHLGRGAIIVGHSPFVERADATVFDELCRCTSMIFFYDPMLAEPDRWRDWGFRHCFGLNFSAPLGPVREVGGFTAFPLLYGYDDIELAWRLVQNSPGTPVLFRPEALAPHDHRYTPAGVLDREHRLGGTAWRFAQASPAFAQDTFGRDVRAAAELAYSREFVRREARDAERVRERFLALDRVPAAALSAAAPGDRAALEATLAQQFVLLKRWAWRRGLLDAAGLG